MKKLLLLLICMCFTHIYILSQDTLWTKKSDLEFPRWHTSANYHNGKIYVIGGVGNYDKVEMYTIETDTWETKTAMPTGRAFMGSGIVDGKIYIIGGMILNQAPVKVVEMYDLVADAWSVVDTMVTGRQGMGSCVYDSMIYTFGGNNPAEKAVQAYDPINDLWVSGLKEMPTARWEPECVLVEDKIYVIGGFLNPATGAASDDVEMYDPAADSWTIKASLPEKRGGGTPVYADGKIFYFGGSPGYTAAKRNVWAYDPELDEWQEYPDMPFAWYLMGSCVVEETIFLMAGSKVIWPHNDNFTGVYVYQPADFVPNSLGKRKSDYTENSYRIYPNPVNNTLYFRRNGRIDHVSYKIYNLQGVLIVSDFTTSGSIDLSGIHNGGYILSIKTEGEIISRIIMKHAK